MIGDSPKGIPTITIPATPAPVVVGCQRFWKRPFIYQIREVITTNSSEKPCVVEWPDGMSHLPLFNAEGPIASAKARIAVRMESGRSGQAATVSLERRRSGFPRVRVENYATIFGANRYPPPAAGCVPRWKRVRGNLIDMITPGRSEADNLDHPVQAIGIGQHLTVTVDNPEQAHGAESSILD